MRKSTLAQTVATGLLAIGGWLIYHGWSIYPSSQSPAPATATETTSNTVSASPSSAAPTPTTPVPSPSVSATSSSAIEANRGPWPSVFDYKRSRFNVSDKGLYGEFLNKLQNKEYQRHDNLEYYKLVDSVEHQGRWTSLQGSEAGFSRLFTLVTTVENFSTIAELDTLPERRIKKEYLPLKKILMRLDSIDSKDVGSIEKLRQMYNHLREHLQPGKVNEESVPIERLARGEVGDCNDMAPAYYAILKYYGYDSYMQFGKEMDLSGKEMGLHAWVGVNTVYGHIDIDPTWYDTFSPLTPRNDSLDMIRVKDKYVTTKNRKPANF